MSLYPQGYKPQEKTSDYMKLEEGDNRFRILGVPIIGYEFWWEEDGRKVKRVKTFQEAVADVNGGDAKEFNAFPVWNYDKQAVQLLNLTQVTIKDAIYVLDTDKDWGDATKYDIVIKRAGKGLDTEYNIVPKPHKPMDNTIVEAFKAVKIVSEEYFQNGHPIVRDDGNGASDDVQAQFEKDIDESLSN